MASIWPGARRPCGLIIRLAREMGIPLDYLETNASWCSDPDRSREKFRQLREAGLPAVLISCSLFHAECIPYERTRIGIEAAQDVFGPGGVLVWQPWVMDILERLPNPQTTATWEEICAAAGWTTDAPQIPQSYGITPGGRAPQALRACYPLEPPEAFRHQICRRILESTAHFHIDPFGNLFTGLCPGIAPGQVDNLHPRITPEAFPAYWSLAEAGPYGLMQYARDAYGFEPDAAGYAGPCDLCQQVRGHLLRSAPEAHPELRPAEFYAEADA